MKFSFQTKELANLCYQGKGAEDYPDFIVNSFFRKISQIKRAKNENDLRALKSNHFEKLKGKDNLYSIRLNDQYRLEFSILESSEKELFIKRISNHYSKK